MKKLVLFILTTLAMLSIPGTAFAARPIDPNVVTYGYIDQYTIQRNDGFTFIEPVDHKADVFQSQNDPNAVPNCKFNNPPPGYGESNGASFIDLNGGSPVLVTWTPGNLQNNYCQPKKSNIVIADSQNSTIQYDWKDSSTIVKVGDGNTIFTGDGSGKFYQNSSGACHSFFTVSQDKTKALLTDSRSTRPNPGIGQSAQHARPYNQQGGCWIAGNNSTWPVSKTSQMAPAGDTYVLGTLNNLSLPPGSGGGSGNSASDGPQCDAGAGLTFILCPIISTAESAIGSPPIGSKPGTGLEGVVSSQLTYSILSDPTGKADVKAYWQAMTYLADVFFIVLFFIVIFGTALGLDNYTVKKILPRLIAAAILIQFSFLLCGLAVDISNVLGLGIPTILHAAIPSHSSADPVGGVNAVFVATGLAGGGALLIASPEIIIPLLLLALSAIISLLTIFFTLEIRIIMITACVILAPVMILLWVLPNTQNIFKRWWRLFMGLLIMYPLITLLIGVGDLMTHLTQAGSNSTFGKIMFSIGPIIVFFLIPLTFKAAGQIFAFAGGKIGSLGDKASGKVDKARGASMARGKEERRLKSAKVMATSTNGFRKGIAARRGGFAPIIGSASARQKAAQSKAIEDYSTRQQGIHAASFIGMKDQIEPGTGRTVTVAEQIRKRAAESGDLNLRKAAADTLVKTGAYGELALLRDSAVKRFGSTDKAYPGGATDAAWNSLLDKHKDRLRKEGHQALFT